MQDAVRASKTETRRMLARSYRIWSSYLDEATDQDGLQPSHVQLRSILGRAPAYLAHGFTQRRGSLAFKLEQRGSEEAELLVSGQSTWSTGRAKCDLMDKETPLQLLLGVQRSTPCHFVSRSCFFRWPGIGHERDTLGGNCLAILAFAWAYILSARWMEMQKPDITEHVSLNDNERMFYLSAGAGWIDGCAKESPGDLEVDLGDVNDEAARWWSAILAAGEGWRAEVARNGSIFRSPWSISIETTQRFRIRRSTNTQRMGKTPLSPPSSEAAIKYLSDFSMFHHLENQCSVALAAALTFPFLGERGVTLPLPNLSSPTSLHSSLIGLDKREGAVFSESKLLPYYMSLSCNRPGMHAVLCSSFFDPRVSCNLVSPWFQPILEILDPLLKAGDLAKVATIMGKREPKLAALWMGAAVSGMANPIFQWIRSGLVATELNASAWTATTHSFISLKSENPCGNNDAEMSRADECRLLYFAGAEGHIRPPICPWKPFGNTRLCDTEIEVRKHRDCRGHYLQYVNWSWILQDGTMLKDPGFTVNGNHESMSLDETNNSHVDLHEKMHLKDERLSENATRNIFGWLRNSGWAKSEKEIYCHSWLDFDESEGEEEHVTSDDEVGQTVDIQQIETWLGEQHTTGWYSGVDNT